MKPSTSPTALPIGINGLKIRKGALSYTNTGLSTFFRIPINTDGSAAGAAVAVATNITSIDDFVLDARGDAFIAQNRPVSSLGMLARGAVAVTPLAPIVGATAVQFGRLPGDRRSVYVTSFGDATAGGRVTRVHVGVRA